MAFNPFSWFREHKKGALVALTILTMILFIGQFGAGDPIGRLMGLVGNTSSGAVVAKLHGKKVRESDVLQLGQQRRMASGYLTETITRAHQTVAKDLTKKVEGPAEGNPLSGVKEILTSYQTGLMELSRTLQQIPGEYRGQFLTNYINGSIDENLRRLEKYLLRKELKDDDRAVLNKMIVLLGARRAMIARELPTTPDGEPQARDSFYFGGSAQTEDLLDFRLWQLQADRLGIKLTDEDVLKEVTEEAAGAEVFDPKKSFAEQDRVVAYLGTLRREKFAVPASDLLDALREEFRVVMAQSVLLGSEPGARAYRSALGVASTPSLATPDEFLRYFREQRTALRIKLYPITAASYLDKVQGTPTEAELLSRYERGAKLEPVPFVREAGFRQPRRFTVEYAVASPEDPFYKAQARTDAEMLRKLSDPAQRLRNILTTFTAPGLARVIPVALDPLGGDFDAELKNEHSWLAFNQDTVQTNESNLKKLHYTSIVHPATVAASVAYLPGDPLGGISSLVLNGMRQEVRASIPVNLSLRLAQTSPGQLLDAAVLAMAAAQALPATTPRSLIEPQVVASKEQNLAGDALRNNFSTMRDELKKLSRKPAEAKAYIARAVKEYHLSLFSMPAPHTAYGILEDLTAKKNLNLDLLRKAMARDDKTESLRQFVNQIAGPPGEYNPEFGGMVADSKQEILFWHSLDKPAEDRPFSKVRPEVVAAWRLDRARTMARDEAERLEAEVNKKANATDVQMFLKEQKLPTPIELDNVVQLAPPAREVQPNPTIQYSPYRIPEEKVDLLPFMPNDLAKQLLKLTRPGQSTVIVDMPAKTYYLAVLVDRGEPSLSDFKTVYARATMNDTLYSRFLAQRRYEYRKSVVEQLRREASGELDRDGRFKLPDTIRREDTSASDTE